MGKTEWLQIRVTEELKEKLRCVAERKSLSMSALALYYVSQGLDNDSKMERLVSPESYNKIFQGLSPEVVEMIINTFNKE